MPRHSADEAIVYGTSSNFLALICYSAVVIKMSSGKSEDNSSLWAAVKRMIDILAGLAVVFTLLFVALQWREMKEGGKDTKALAEAAKTQAEAAKAQSEQAEAQTKKMAESLSKTDNLIRQATAQAKAGNELARAARRSADIANEALEAGIESGWEDRRPWVGLQAFQCNGCTETDGNLRIGVLAGIIANTGKTPAIRMSIHVGSILNIRKSDPIPDWDSMQRESDEREKKSRERLPPDIAAQISKSMEILNREMSAQTVLPPNGTEGLNLITGTSIGRPKDIRERHEMLQYVVGKITYYDIRQASEQHTTKFCLVNNYGVDFHFCASGNSMD